MNFSTAPRSMAPAPTATSTATAGGVRNNRTMPPANNFSFAAVGLSPAQANSIWQALRSAIVEIQTGNQGRLRFEELYRHAYTLVLHKHGDMLYKGVDDMLTERMMEVARMVRQASDAYLLDALVSAWQDHQLKQSMLKDILMYMDKTYARQMSLPTVYERGVQRFRDIVVLDPAVQGRIRTIMLDNVRRERDNELIDGTTLRHCCSLLVEVNLLSLDLYQRVFEDDLLAQTRQFYAAESQRLVVSTSVPDYLRACEARLADEESRADRYFDLSTKGKLRAILQDELLVRYAQRIIADPASGAAHMLQAGAVDDLGRMYALFCREPQTLIPLRDALSTLVRSTGASIVSERVAPTVFVDRILSCRSHFMRIVSEAFKDDRNFAHTLKDALEHAVNLDSRAAMYLSAYTDEIMRKQQGHTSGGLSDKELDSKLNDVLSLFRYLSDKDVFEEYYKQHLALRLLEYANVTSVAGSAAAGGSAATELERIMIAKLKAECGHQFTSKLEGMFRDMDLSRQLMRTWRDTDPMPTSGPVCELNVAVLTTGFWPLPAVPQCKLPAEAEALTARFRSFYLAQHSGRKLAWHTSLGSAELRCHFECGRRELVVHTYAMCILLLFNHGDKLSFADIQRATGIPTPELTQQLLSLAHPAVKVLLKNPPGKACAPDHRFKWNTKYQSNMYRNRIAVLSKQAAGIAGTTGGAGGGEAAGAGAAGSSEGGAASAGAASSSSSSASALPASIVESRQFSVEASVVRILKSRKRMEHSALLAEVSRQLSGKFPVEPAFVKKRIEALIEREYMERDPENRRIYVYKA